MSFTMMKCETNLLQDFNEFTHFLKLIKAEGVSSYLEIGSKHGGSLWRIANTLPRGSRVVSVDLPNGDGSFKNSQPNLEQCVDTLFKLGYDAHLFIGDSTDPEVIRDVGKLAPFDLCFIDGYHTEEFVRSDWKHYGAMARIVAFHDIGWKADGRKSKKQEIEAPKVWQELKKQYRYKEIMFCSRDYGIGVLWRS